MPAAAAAVWVASETCLLDLFGILQVLFLQYWSPLLWAPALTGWLIRADAPLALAYCCPAAYVAYRPTYVVLPLPCMLFSSGLN